MTDLYVPSGGGDLRPDELVFAGQVAETINETIRYLGLRALLKARLEEIDRDYRQIDMATAGDLHMHARQSEIARITIGALIDKGHHEQAVDIFKHYMNGTPSFVTRVTDVIMKRLDQSPLNNVTKL